MHPNFNLYINSLLFGTLLGDGYCSPRGIIDVTRANLNYVNWFYSQLVKHKCAYKPPRTIHYPDKRTKKTYTKHVFYTKALFRNYRKMFYFLQDDGTYIKKIPKEFKDMLNNVVLAIWYLDDGGKASGVRNGVFITLDGFTFEEAIVIKECFLEVFDLETNIQKAGKSRSGREQRRLYINTAEYPKFHALVYPIISQIPDLHAKKLPDVIKESSRFFSKENYLDSLKLAVLDLNLYSNITKKEE